MTAGPIPESERAEILDILRGFALLGIFLAHTPGFSGWDYLSASEQVALDPGTDSVLEFLRQTFISGKFFSLFSLLFGFGFAIQHASARRRGATFRPQFRRRQLGLLGIGIVHSGFWHGDILLTYALLGLLFLPVADWPPSRVLRWGLGAFAMRGIWPGLIYLFAGSLENIGNSAVGAGPGEVDVGAGVKAMLAGYYSSEWREMLPTNFRFLRTKWLFVLYEGKLFSIAGCFLVGIALGKWRIHERTRELSARLGQVAWLAGFVGIFGNLALAILWDLAPTYPPTKLGVATGFLYSIAVPALALAMAAFLAATQVGHKRIPGISWFAAPGRMALTTYLTQTTIGIGVFYGVGFGVRGRISLTEALLFAMLIFSLQTVASHLWLRQFRFGPIEWLWRCFTYSRMLPLRRIPASLA